MNSSNSDARRFPEKRGIMLLLAVLIASVAMVIALGIYSLIFGQILLGKGAAQSHKAFFAAETGVECALYYLWRGGDEAGFSFWDPVDHDSNSDGIHDGCAGGACQIVCADTPPVDADYNTTQDGQEDINGGPLALSPSPNGIPSEVFDDDHIYDFTISNNDPDIDICADVRVRTRYRLSSKCAPDLETIVESRGYSTCNTGLSRVNRTLQVTYGFADRTCIE